MTPRPRVVHIASTPPVHDDELAARIRSLEAERLRPVPPPPPKKAAELAQEHLDEAHRTQSPRPRTRRTAPARADRGLRALRAAGTKYRQQDTNPEGDRR